MNLENMQASAFDVLALAASAGGHTAVTTILQQLPRGFSVPIVVIQHLAADTTSTDDFYRHLVPFAVEWVRRDSALAPGKVLLCPPRSFVDLLPDGSFVLSPNEQGTLNRPIDHLLESVARSFGPHAIGVVLTGMGSDGALGARALHLAGGRVLVQNEASAEFSDMPKAAIQAGAADLVAPLEDLGQVIGEMAGGAARPQPRSEIEAIRHTFGEKSAVAAQAREIDWWHHPLGPVHRWPTQLREFVRMAVEYMDPAQLIWGEDQLVFFNDAAIPSYGSRWMDAFARPFREAFPDVTEVKDIYARVLAGEHVRLEGRRFAHVRSGQVQDAWFDVVHNPVYGTGGTVLGSFNVWYERTQAVLAARRLHAINRLATAPAAANRRAAIEETLALLGTSADVSFAAAYLVDEARRQALLGGTFGVEAGGELAPQQFSIRSHEEPWPLAQVVNEGRTVVIEGLAARFGSHPAPHDRLTPRTSIEPGPGSGPRPGAESAAAAITDTAVIHPLRDEVAGRVIGALVLGTNPRLLLDEDYRAFLTLAAETIEAKVAESHAQERERERLAQLAELDRAKTDFFANVSHEFRTPITLMLAPLEDLLRQGAALPPSQAKGVEVATANARRLLRLVNSLLDFSQIDARRQQPNFEPVDLCALTTDIASVFRSAVEAAGLRYRVECDPNLPPVWVDRDMWEKIVSNLLSNAFKFTFEGEIVVELRALSLHAELTVRDTGIGIPEQELPNLFKRFHRVHGAKARTVEGAGIGLSIVEELVKRMGGQLTVRSREHQGSSFTIWIPYKTVRIRGDAAVLPAPGSAGPVATKPVAAELARDASRWLVDGETSPDGVMEDLLGPPSTSRAVVGDPVVRPLAGEDTREGRLLIADDNADLRAYLQRLLGLRWEVELAADGETALAAATRLPPDAILADVMMPGLDGFELIRRIREVPQLKHTPVILLTARTGEEAAIQGLLAGAGDYIAKPFSPRELVARIQAVVERAKAGDALRQSEERYRTLFESIDEGFCIVELLYDDDGNAVNYRFLDVNEAYMRHTGMENPIGKLGSEVVPDTESHWLNTYGTVARTGVSVHFSNCNEPTGRWYESYAARVGGDESRQVAIVFNDVTERKRIERRQEFIMKLADALRPLSDAVEIQRAATQILGEFLEVDWALYNELSDDGTTIHIEDSYVRGDCPKVKGDFPVRAFGAAMDVLRRGELLVIEDQMSVPLKTPLEREASISLGVFASATVPLIKEGHWVANLGVLHRSPRRWTEDEIAILQETAERTWSAVERARIGAALREAEEKYRAELEEEVRQRTAELRQAEEFLQATLDSSPYIVQAFKAVRDESGQIADFVWVFNNRAGYRQNGDVIGKSLLQQNPGVVETGLFAKFVEVTETGAVYDHEQFYNREQFDGWFHQTLVKMGDGFVMNTEDITDRKRAEAAAARSSSTRETQV